MFESTSETDFALGLKGGKISRILSGFSFSSNLER